MRKHRFAVYAVMTATVLFSAMAGTFVSALANSAEVKRTTVNGNPQIQATPPQIQIQKPHQIQRKGRKRKPETVLTRIGPLQVTRPPTQTGETERERNPPQNQTASSTPSLPMIFGAYLSRCLSKWGPNLILMQNSFQSVSTYT